MKTSVTTLRTHLYEYIDQLIVSGVPIELERKGHKIKIVLDDPPAKLNNLKIRPKFILGDPDDIIDMDWLQNWNREID